MDSHITNTLPAHLNYLFVATTSTFGVLNAVAFPAILVDCIVPVAGTGSLVAIYIAPHLEQPVIGRRAFGVLNDIPRGAILYDLILFGGAEFCLVSVPFSLGKNRDMVEVRVGRGPGDGGGAEAKV
jgi:hypothetical protein